MITILRYSTWEPEENILDPRLIQQFTQKEADRIAGMFMMMMMVMMVTMMMMMVMLMMRMKMKQFTQKEADRIAGMYQLIKKIPTYS